PLIRAVETYDDATGAHSGAAPLSGRVVVARRPPLGVETADEAVAVALDTDGRLTLSRIAELLGVDEKEARDQLAERVYDDPADGRIVPRAEYLAGNIATKPDAARAAAAADPRHAANATARRSVTPTPAEPA